MPKYAQISARLLAHQAEQLERIRSPYTPLIAPYVQHQTRTLLNFTSNDYLSLGQHPDIIATAQQAVQSLGLGALGSSIAQGYTDTHQQLEQRLATWLDYPRALVFTSGYLAVLATLTALITADDCVAVDKQSHACVFDAVRLTQAHWQRYADDDMARLENILQHRTKGARFIITSGIFSMQGHIAHLAQLSALAQQYDATLIVDDVHGSAVLGPEGQGSVAHLGLSAQTVPIIIGSLSKGLGTMGAFVAGDAVLIEAILQFARPYMFSTALPAALAQASHTAIEIVRLAHTQRAKLQTLSDYFNTQASMLNLSLLPTQTPIKAIVFPDISSLQQVTQRLLEKNILVSPIRPPTVPAASPRIRITLSSAHEIADIDHLLSGLAHG